MVKAQKIEKPRAEWGSDVVVDLLKAFEIEYVAINPGATFRGLHDSLVNYALHARRNRRGVGARLCASKRQAHGRRGAQRRGSAACIHGDL